MLVREEVDPTLATALGFPKQVYTAVEHERRWLCGEVPRELIRETLTVNDLYVTRTRLRLREMRPIAGGAGRLRLTRKADIDAQTRLITSIYLPEDEFAVLAASLTGARLRKLRHRLHAPHGVSMSLDEFQGELTGLFLVEAECNTAEAVAVLPMPSFATREVTGDTRYTGASLARHGIPT
jgi:CYTH domain-containing protein